jgi:hypothetical protein
MVRTPSLLILESKLLKTDKVSEGKDLGKHKLTRLLAVIAFLWGDWYT